MCAVAREVARQQALLLEAMAAVASTSIGIGFDADEVAFALHLPRTVAQRGVSLARDLLGRLPAVSLHWQTGGSAWPVPGCSPMS